MSQTQAVSFVEDIDEQTGVYTTKRAGRVLDGAKVYGAEGCYLCHSQLVRPTYAGSDVWRLDWAGDANHPDGDTRRETNVYDYAGERFAQIGLTRTGPDLSNVGVRIRKYAKEAEISPEEWAYMHLYNPRHKLTTSWSVCPSSTQLFRTCDVQGQGSLEALSVDSIKDGEQLIPKESARALVSYLLSLKKDNKVPASIDYSR